ncbi:MAG: hypothetical protein AB8F95_01050 [Bacteroidia bacterium]
MKDQEEKSELEIFYEESNWQSELRNTQLKRAIRILSFFARLIFGLYFIIFTVFFFSTEGLGGFWEWILGIILSIAGLILIAAIISALFAIIPYKSYTYKERMRFLFLASILAIELIPILILLSP